MAVWIYSKSPFYCSDICQMLVDNVLMQMYTLIDKTVIISLFLMGV